jgi:3-hydroxyacyl-[acyl-carrier-protein] dehydratase
MMTVLEKAYTIEKKTAETDGQAFDILLNPKHPLYDGHFPGMPVTPGVVVLSIVRDCGSEMLGKHIRFASIENCKFLAAIRPDINPRFSLHIQMKADNRLLATAEYGGETSLKLKATWTTE